MMPVARCPLPSPHPTLIPARPPKYRKDNRWPPEPRIERERERGKSEEGREEEHKPREPNKPAAPYTGPEKLPDFPDRETQPLRFPK